MRLGRTNRMKPLHCPNCNKLLDAATSAGQRKPKPGDVSICLGCNGIMIFDNDLLLRQPTPGEWKAIAVDSRIATLQVAIDHLHNKKEKS